MRKDSELVLLVPLFPTFLLGMLPMLILPLVGVAGLTVIGKWNSMELGTFSPYA